MSVSLKYNTLSFFNNNHLLVEKSKSEITVLLSSIQSSLLKAFNNSATFLFILVLISNKLIEDISQNSELEVVIAHSQSTFQNSLLV